MTLSNDLWQVIKKYAKNDAPDWMKEELEHRADIEVFDGGAFIAIGNEFDLFILPERRGKWRIRSIVTDYLRRMEAKYGKVVVRINEQNTPSLRLARHFGFTEVSRDNGMIKLEK